MAADLAREWRDLANDLGPAIDAYSRALKVVSLAFQGGTRPTRRQIVDLQMARAQVVLSGAEMAGWLIDLN